MTTYEKIILFAAAFSAILYGIAQLCTIAARLIQPGKFQTILFYIGHDAKAVADIIASIAPRGTSPNAPEISPPGSPSAPSTPIEPAPAPPASTAPPASPAPPTSPAPPASPDASADAPASPER